MNRNLRVEDYQKENKRMQKGRESDIKQKLRIHKHSIKKIRDKSLTG